MVYGLKLMSLGAVDSGLPLVREVMTPGGDLNTVQSCFALVSP